MYQSGSEFPQAALMPYANEKRNRGRSSSWRPEMWSRWTCMTTASSSLPMSLPSRTQAQAIEQFVCTAGLMSAPGDQCRCRYVHTFFSWLPGELQSATPESATGYDCHLSRLAIRLSIPKGPRRIRRRRIGAKVFPIQPNRGTALSVLASFSDGKPFSPKRRSAPVEFC